MDIVKQFEPIFDVWRIDKFIGAGSFGRVYRIAREDFDGTQYYSALKFISIPQSDAEMDSLVAEGMDNAAISRYYEELAIGINEENQIMNRLKGHTNIVSYEDSRVIPRPNGLGYNVFIRMELLTALPDHMKVHSMSRHDIIKLGIDICKALEVCSKCNIIHRDVKPDNIFINKSGDYKLGDFGIAKVLDKSVSILSKKGTYNYMAPEVYKGELYDNTVDIYSLGMVMYKLLNCGRLPFIPVSSQKITPQIRENALKKRMRGEMLMYPCEAVDDLGEAVLTACAFDPLNRFHTPADFRAVLENILIHESVAPNHNVANNLGDRADTSVSMSMGSLSSSIGSYADDSYSSSPYPSVQGSVSADTSAHIQNLTTTYENQVPHTSNTALENDAMYEQTNGVWDNNNPFSHDDKTQLIWHEASKPSEQAGFTPRIPSPTPINTSTDPTFDVRSYSQDDMYKEEYILPEHKKPLTMGKLMTMILGSSLIVATLCLLIIYGIPYLIGSSDANSNAPKESPVAFSAWIDGTPPPEIVNGDYDLQTQAIYYISTVEETKVPEPLDENSDWQLEKETMEPESEWRIQLSKPKDSPNRETNKVKGYRYFLVRCPECNHFDESMYEQTDKCPKCGANLKSEFYDVPYSKVSYTSYKDKICLVDAKAIGADSGEYFFYADTLKKTSSGSKSSNGKVVIKMVYKTRTLHKVYFYSKWSDPKKVTVKDYNSIPDENAKTKITNIVYQYCYREKNQS